MGSTEEDVRAKLVIDPGDGGSAALAVHIGLDSPSTSPTIEEKNFTPAPVIEGTSVDQAELESYETTFHCLVPDKIDGTLYISGDGGSLGNMQEENAVEMRRGSSPNHWMSPTIKMQCPGLQFNFLIIKHRGMLNPMRLVDQQKVTKDSKEPHCGRPHRHNFIFPRGKKSGGKEFKMTSSRGNQMSIFLEYLTRAVDSVESLVDTLTDFLNLVDMIVWKGKETRQGKPEVEARTLLLFLSNSIPDLCNCREAKERDLRRIFLSVVGCFVLAHHEEKSGQDTQLRTACSSFLSCFDGFQSCVGEGNRLFSSIPQWAMSAIRGRSCESILRMVKLSSNVSYEWINQIPGLLIACRGLEFLNHVWEAPRGYGGISESATIPSPGTDQEFMSAVESIMRIPQVADLLGSLQNVALVRSIISAAPGVRSIFMLASQPVFYPSKTVLGAHLKRLFRRYPEKCLDMIKVMRQEWESQRSSAESLEPEKEGVDIKEVHSVEWGSGLGSSTSVQESHILAPAVKSILLEKIGNVEEWSRQEQAAYLSFVQDRSVFSHGLLDFAKGLQNGKPMYYGSWPNFFVERFFLGMLPSAVESCKGDRDGSALVRLCEKWLEERFQMKRHGDRFLSDWFAIVEELLHRLEGLDNCQDLVEEISRKLLTKCQNKVETGDVVELLKCSHSMADVKTRAIVDSYFASARKCLERNRLRRPSRGVDWNRAIDYFNALVPQNVQGNRIIDNIVQLMNIILNQVSPFTELEGDQGASTLSGILQALSENGAEFWERVVEVQFRRLPGEVVHNGVIRLVSEVDEIATAAVWGNITLEDARVLIGGSEGLQRFCRSLVRKGGSENFPVEVHAQELRELDGRVIVLERAIAGAWTEMTMLQDFVGKICRPFGAHNVTQEYLDLLRQRERDLPRTLASELHSDENESWQKLGEISEHARSMHPFSQSTIFISALESIGHANQEDPPQTMEDCIQLIEPAFDRYQDLWRPFFEGGEVLLSQARDLLSCHRGASIDNEFSLAEEHLGNDGSSSLVFPVRGHLEVVKQVFDDEEVCGCNLATLLQRTEDVWSLDKEGHMHYRSASILYRWDSKECVLADFAADYREIRLLVEQTCPKDWHLRDYLGLLCDLSAGRHMVEFVKEIGNEDIRMLSDSVEDSDSFIREDTVACFIAVKGFVSGLVTLEGAEIEDFMEHLSRLLARHSTIDNPIAPQLKLVSENIFAIKSLYERVSDRGEFTKVVVKHAMTNSSFTFETDESGYPATQQVLTLRNAQGIQKVKYSMADLQDYRSRTLLLIDTPDRLGEGGSVDDQKEMEVFIEVVDLSTEIVALLKALAEIGHFALYDWGWTCQPNTNVEELASKLSRLRNDLERSLEGWKEHLRLSRQRYYVLNFLRSRQINFVWNKVFCEENGWEDVKEILSTYTPAVMQREIPIETDPPVESPEDRVIQLGQWLEELSDLPPRRRPIPHSFVHTSACVENGELFVGICDREHAFNVILSMYAASGFFPEPGELLICNESTDWEDIELLLLRCQLSEGTCRQGRLFCLAGVDSLLVEVQTQVVEYLAHTMGRDQEGNTFKLGILSGSKHCYLVDQFKGAIRPVKAMSDEEVGELFAQQFEKEGPSVVILTSEASGMGKTDRVKEIHSQRDGEFITVPISGPLSHHDLIRETRRHLAGREANSNLHLDVSGVSHIAGVDNFLFELIVLNHTASKESCLLLDVDQDTVISIELANTLCEELRIGMHFCQLAPVVDIENAGGTSSGELPSFSREHLVWDVSRFKVSQDLTSNVQIVCHHLDALQNLTFAGADLDLEADGVQPLDAEQCRTLLQRHFCQHVSFPSFSVLTAFLKVFAWQLRSLSLSCFFMVETLQWVGRNQAVRLDLLRSLLEVSRHFTIESSSAAFMSQQQQSALLEIPIEERMAERVQRLVSWEDNNHLMILFNQGDGHSITAVYRSIREVPRNVTELIMSQREENMPDFVRLHHWELCLHLLRILGLPEMVPFDGCHYVLTPDNFLKMVLLHVRIRANVPVVIMGETGCGKTSLIRYLAGMSQVQFETLNIHAGTSRKAIREFIRGVEAQSVATGEEVWAFLDEINTCSELGMINDLVCHKQIDGRDLRPGVTILVACNPYRVKDRSLPTAGYELSRRNRRTELVYSVHPLPETMMAYVWDYGELNKDAQRLYLTSMLEDSEAKCLETSGLLKVTTDVLLLSQEFIRTVETPWSTSLRDFKRWILLFTWFRDKLSKSPKSERYDPSLLTGALDWVLYGGGRIRREREHNKEINQRSVILALSICYYMRLGEASLRISYLEQISDEFAKHRIELAPRHFLHILKLEQEDYIARMTLPRGVAKNRALLENVFAGIVCILNRLPLFMVGKPGCSKSLSLQLIHSNLRGPDSSEELFRNFPQIIFVSFQGSETSTSDGILKIFEKAQKFLKPDGRTMPVVLLDEIGLAEISPHNPLKVLHSLLEPGYPRDRPDVAVVGISNWALDAAKMNRAIVLSRPDPGVKDLGKTADAIQNSIMDGARMSFSMSDKMQKLASEYHRYVANQPVENFHGLRDFYSLIKSLCEKAVNSGQDLSEREFGVALARSFGGLDPQATREIIENILYNIGGDSHYHAASVKDLIKDSIRDKTSRHLMLITKGDFVLDVLKNDILKDVSPVVMYGSTFPEDDSDSYTYRVLSRIRLCLGEGRVLVLKNLDKVYGALYDMLNQNYTEVGGRKYCRIALGAHSNPMCHVHPDFRCIVFMDHSELENADPPFLNRFEKQHLDLDIIFNRSMRGVLRLLEEWVGAISSQPNSVSANAGQAFGPKDMFAGMNDITLKSLVLRCSRDLSSEGQPSESQLFEACKTMLSKLAFLDGVVRAKWSVRAREDIDDVREWCANYYLYRPTSLKDLLSRELELDTGIPNSSSGQEICAQKSSRLVVMTELPVKPQTIESLASVVDVERYQLHTLTSERSISEVIKSFFASEIRSGPKPKLLMFEASSRQDGRAFQLLRFLVDQQRAKYLAEGNGEGEAGKHVCVVIQMDRSQISQRASKSWQFHFLSGWEQALVCDPDGEGVPAERLLNDNLLEILTTETLPLREVIGKVLFRCFLCQKYDPRFDSVEHIREVVTGVREDPKLMDCVCMRIKKALEGVNLRRAWQHEVACSRAKVANSGGVLRAAELFVEERVKNLAAKLVFVLEKGSSLKSYFQMDPERQEIWRDLLMDDGVVSIDNIPDPAGFEHFSVGLQPSLDVPFVHGIINAIQGEKELYRQEAHDGSTSIGNKIVERLETTLHPLLMDQFSIHPDMYVSDFVTNLAYEHFLESADVFQSVFMRALHQARVSMEQRGDFIIDCILAHIVWWSEREEISSLVQLMHICPDLLQHLDGLSEGAQVTNSNILRLTLQKIRSDLEAIENMDDARSWVVESDSMLSKLHALEDRMSNGEKEILADHRVVVDFMGAISGAENLGAIHLQIVKELRIHLGFESTMVLRSASGIQTLCRVLEDLLNATPDLIAVDSLNRAMSRFLSSCFESGRSTEGRLDCYKATWDYVMLDPVPPHSMSVVISMLRGIGADLQGGVEFQDGGSPSSPFVLALHLLDVMRNEAQAYVEVPLAVVRDAVSPRDVDSDAVALLADGMQVFAFDDLVCGMFENPWKVGDIGMYMNSALGVLSDPCSYGTVRVVIATALMRATLERLPNLFGQWMDRGGPAMQQGGFLSGLQNWWNGAYDEGNQRVRSLQEGFRKESDGVKLIIATISKAFESQSNYIHALHEYLLKVLRRNGLSIQQIRELSADLRQADVLRGPLVWNPLEGNDKLKSHGFNLIPGFEEAQVIMATAIQKPTETQDLIVALESAARNPDQRRAIVAATAALFYLPRFWRDLDKEEEDFIEQLARTLLNWPARDWEMLLKFASNNFPGSPLEASQSAGPQHVQSIVLQINLILCVIVGEGVSPLSVAWQVDRLAGTFLPTMPEDETNVAFQTMEAREGGARYQCGHCDFIFSIGNCGQPNQRFQCLKCGKAIGGGGSNRRIDHTPPRPAQAGYIPTAAESSHGSVRNLTPFGFRLLRLWIHTVMRWGYFFNENQKKPLERTFNGSITLLEEMFVKDCTVVRELLPPGLGQERGFLLLNALVSRFGVILRGRNALSQVTLGASGDRDRWEDQFMQDVVKPICDNVQRSIGDYIERVGVDHAHGLEARIDESEEGRYFQKLFRMRQPISMEVFRQQFHGSVENAAAYPLTAYLLEELGPSWDGHMLVVPHLWGILKWNRAVQSRLNRKIMREDAVKESVEQFLAKHSDLEELYAEFEDAWNTSRHVTTRYECTDLDGGIPEMTRQSSIAMSLYEKRNQGLYLAALMAHLVQVQNSALRDISHAMSDGKYRSQRIEESSICVLRKEQILNINLDQLETCIVRSGFIQWETMYGRGLQLEINMYGIEASIVKYILSGACFIDMEEMEEVVFLRETFLRHATMISDVALKCEQVEIEHDQVAALREEMLTKSEHGLVDFFAALEVIMCVLKRTGCKRKSSIVEFVGAWIDDHRIKRMFSSSGGGGFFGQMLMENVVGWYELVEELLGAGSCDEIRPEYRQDMAESMEAAVVSIIDAGRDTNGGPKLRRSAFRKTLSQFIFRFLSAGEDSVRADVPLEIYLCDPRCVVWPSCSVVDYDGTGDIEDVISDVLPDGLLVGHCYALLQLLKRNEE